MEGPLLRRQLPLHSNQGSCRLVPSLKMGDGQAEPVCIPFGWASTFTTPGSLRLRFVPKVGIEAARLLHAPTFPTRVRRHAHGCLGDDQLTMD